MDIRVCSSTSKFRSKVNKHKRAQNPNLNTTEEYRFTFTLKESSRKLDLCVFTAYQPRGGCPFSPEMIDIFNEGMDNHLNKNSIVYEENTTDDGWMYIFRNAFQVAV